MEQPKKLEMAGELFKIRKDIELDIELREPKLTILFEGYAELQQAYGHPKPTRSNCGNCVPHWRKIIKNWFKQCDTYGVAPQEEDVRPENVKQALRGGTGDNILLPIESRRKELESLSFGELKDLLEEGVYTTLNSGKRPSKKAIINHLLGV